ncbi:hypothetical protein GCM10010435_31250 [Winogradskya consettensis]|uniref:Uncharacterized protein n=1 Tax=Winogradskya consettensis TaxID=113560 RepID=A0A919SGU5_9ACTN|nr:hypothetical protein [Actinoplanes consettensis]GIM70428.1 hypothetical protein Aco04nite_20250 [Actinoplanes consettensis]
MSDLVKRAGGNTRWIETNKEMRRSLAAGAIGAISDGGMLTVREVAETVGMSVVTANKLLNALTAAGAIEEVARRRVAKGPKPRVFRVPRAGFVTVHADGLRMVARGVDAYGIGRVVTVAGDLSPEGIAGLCAQVSDGAERVREVVVGIPSDLPAGTAERLAAGATELIGSSVRVRPNAHLAALAEAEIGAGRDCGDFVLVSADPSLRVTMVLDGKPRTGRHGAAGAVHRMFPHLAGLPQGHERTLSAITLVCMVADPALVVLSRPLTRSDELLDEVRETVARRVPTPPRIVGSAVAGDPVLAGAARLASAGMVAELAGRATVPSA